MSDITPDLPLPMEAASLMRRLVEATGGGEVKGDYAFADVYNASVAVVYHHAGYEVQCYDTEFNIEHFSFGADLEGTILEAIRGWRGKAARMEDVADFMDTLEKSVKEVAS